MFYDVKKVVIITEKLIRDGVLKIVEAAGATGYTVHETGGKGSRGIRSEERPHVVEAFFNVQVDVIATEAVARQIAEEVAATYFTNYSGITYVQDVEILRPAKFEHHT
ncbi:MAG: hypothetical protein AAGF92_03400 [Myxococcota bacterium]